MINFEKLASILDKENNGFLLTLRNSAKIQGWSHKILQGGKKLRIGGLSYSSISLILKWYWTPPPLQGLQENTTPTFLNDNRRPVTTYFIEFKKETFCRRSEAAMTILPLVIK